MKNIITIGRQFGSGGLRIAKEIGSRLGIPVYDSELILKAAQDSGFSAELFIKNDEKKESFFSSVFGLGSENCTSENGLFQIPCVVAISAVSAVSAITVSAVAIAITSVAVSAITIWVIHHVVVV